MEEKEMKKGRDKEVNGYIQGVLVINCSEEGSVEINFMTETIVRKKKLQGYEVASVEFRNYETDRILSRDHFEENVNVQQLIIAGHGCYYETGGEKVCDFYDRSVGEYDLDEISNLVFQILEKYESIEEIKFYVCESASCEFNDEKSLLKKPRKKPKVLEQNRKFSGCGNHHRKRRRNKKKKKKKKKRRNHHNEELVNDNIFYSVLQKKDTDRFENLVKTNRLQYLSNVEYIILSILRNRDRERKKERRRKWFMFEGINGVGYIDSNDGEIFSFDREFYHFFLEFRERDRLDLFEKKFVHSKKTVDKISYFVNM